MAENMTGTIVSERVGDTSILLIDHDTSSITSLTSMLEQFSYKVINVNEASKAVPMIEQKKNIGLIIANIEMPHIDSHSFLTDLFHKDIPLILICPETNTKEASELLTKGACYCLKKPISEDDIKNLWQHVVPKKRQELEKSNIAEKQENAMSESMKQIETFRENIKRQRTTSQASLLGKRPFIKLTFTTSETYQKRKNIANAERKTKMLCPIEVETKRKMESNVGRRYNLWTYERHMKFLAAISILGDKDSRPRSILRIMNDPNLTHRQVASHLQKYKAQVERINDTLPRNEWRANDKTFVYPSDYEYPFNASNLRKNLIARNPLSSSLRKKKSPSSSIVQFSFRKPTAEKNGKMPEFHLGGKLGLNNHSLDGNVLNKPSTKAGYVPSATSNNPPRNTPFTNDVNHSGLSSDNPPVLSRVPSSVGASSLAASSGICIPQPDPNPFQSSSSVLETDRNQLDLDHLHIPDSNVPQADLSTMGETYFLPGYTMNPLETNRDHMGWVPSTENYSHHETNMSHMDWIPSTGSYVLPEADMNITVPETNTNQMGLDSLGEGYVSCENMNLSEITIDEMGRVSCGENYGVSQGMVLHESDTNHVGLVSGETPPETNTNQMDWLFSDESYLLLENMMSSESNNTTQVGLASHETSYAALDNVNPLEANMEETGLVPYEESNDVPIEDLISFDIDVNEMDIDSWLEKYDFSERNVPLPTSYIGDDHLGSTSQQHNMMESCGYQNIEAVNQREALERGETFHDPDESMDWIDEILNNIA